MNDALPITVLTAINRNPRYMEFAAWCGLSLKRSNPDVEWMLYEADCDDYAEALHIEAIPETPERRGWLIIMDADCWVRGDLRELLPYQADISLRIANAWRKGQINHREWYDICARFELRNWPVYSNGVMAMRWQTAVILKHCLRNWMHVLPNSEMPYPVHIKKRGEWWMRDQLALAATIAERRWAVRDLTARHFSWNYNGESGGIVHHLGKKVNPLSPEHWDKYRGVPDA